MNKRRSFLPLLLLLLSALCIFGCSSRNTPVNTADPDKKTEIQELSGKLTVSFIDVGQGDSELIQLPNGENLLIDAGTNETGAAVVAYLNSQGIQKIDYLLGTHPHEDHIGGMDTVIKSFAIGKVYMPQVTTTTKTFADVLDALKEKGLKITAGHAGMTIYDQDGLKISLFAPGSNNYKDLNNWSIVTKVEFGDTSFLFTGDAEELSESEMLKSGVNLKADVLKVGHHGSSSSTSPAFLKAVSPKYAVISLGKDNDYGHPHQETLEKLTAAGVNIYRTDQDGTVVVMSDGKNLTVEALASSIQPRAPNATVTPAETAENTTYIGNKNSKVFHRSDCSSLPAEKNRVYFKKREEALKAGFKPCTLCNP